MSIHKSLKLRNTLVRQRSVLSRWERVLKLQDAGRWKEGDAILGLPKVRTKFKVRTRKKEEKAAAPGAEGAAAAPADAKAGAAPAAGGKAAAAPAAAKGAAPAKGAAAAAPAKGAAPAAPAKKK
jgi:small basic protein (TIGR04137 family)